MVKLTEDEVRKLLARFVGINKPTLLGIVKSVNKTDNTCVVEDDGVDIPGVRLGSVTGTNKGIVLYPKTKAFILCVKVEDTEEYSMLSASEYDSIEIKIESLVVNGGKFGGLVISEKIVDEMEKQINRINDIVISLSTLASAMTATAQAPVLGAALGTAITSAIADVINPLSVPQSTVFENDKIKH